MKKTITIFSILLVIIAGTCIGISALDNEKTTPILESREKNDDQTAILRNGGISEERKKMLEEKENYINNADSNTGMDADGYYNESERISVQSINDKEESRIIMENHHKQEIESAKKLEKLQQAIIIVNNKKNTNYDIIDKIEMDYNVMSDATDLLYNDASLTINEYEMLEFYIGNFNIAILPEDPLRRRIDSILGIVDNTDTTFSMRSSESAQ